ncbi:hypothetical protein LOZ51_004072 [Ophidiomyces ophidiicola]|nr:hypothetical protein LOZ54_005807 [Ophidiomyces ophidiicola]KAI1993693.1 hypothetical protein LOZ51_004072 [Ophidiomyces ophidiicola]
MSGPMPSTSQPENPRLGAFKSDYFDDPFLSHPLSTEEQLVPQQLFARSTEPLSDTSAFVSPTIPPNQGYALSAIASGRSSPAFMSPTSNIETGQSDLSSYSSPRLDNTLFGDHSAHLLAGFADLGQFCIDPEVLHPAPALEKSTPPGNATGNAYPYSPGQQLLSPVLTGTPGSFSGQQLQDPLMKPSTQITDLPAATLLAEKRPNLPTLRLPTPSIPCENTPNLCFSHILDHPPSPVVKISSYCRGDSPSRDNDVLSRASKRESQSSIHLAPEDDISKDVDEYGVEDSCKYSRNVSSSPTLRAGDGSWIPDPSTGLGGLNPSSRTDEFIPSLKEITAQRELEEKNAVVERWLSVSEVNSEVEDNSLFGFHQQKKWRFTRRRRARSTGDSPFNRANNAGTAQEVFDDSTIPGPGVLIDEESEAEDDVGSHTSDSSPPRSPSGIDTNSRIDSEDGYFPSVDNTNSQTAEPLPRQFIRARPWKDPPGSHRHGFTKDQPFTSNAAIYKFLRRADNIETASRRATWGTRDVTEVDVESILGNNSRFDLMRISDEGIKEKFFRRNSIFEHASKLLPKRSHSGAKRKHNTSAHQIQPSTESLETGKGNSILPQRKPSFTRRSKTPSNTGGALLEMGRQIASVGGGPMDVQSPKHTGGPWSSLMRRNRSRSDVPKDLQSPTISQATQPITTSSESPPPTLASPIQNKAVTLNTVAENFTVARHNAEEHDDDNEEDDEDASDEKGVVMDFSVRVDLIVPTLEGFKTHVQQLNPRLSPALVDRIGREQLLRYKKLVELKLKHAQAVSRHACTAGPHCFAQGGDSNLFPGRGSPKDADPSHHQFHPSAGVLTPEDANAAGETVITASLFPSGVPLPPARRLPARFECPLCFKVKEFKKPSDWTKHVHEDIQPFTCTFPECPEPKSFKRKADWVRHETERHRHLEWWACNIADCSHVCYRKDNFVQHLVREHKMPEPKLKGGKGRQTKPSKALHSDLDLHTSAEVEKVWEMVESCRHVTTKQPTEEACRFCGNVCNTWKKLTVHMAKHMEQAAMPILNLVDQRTVGLNTGMSSIDDSTQSNMAASDGYFGTADSRNKSSIQSRGRHKGRSGPQPIVYGTAALLTEAFSIQQPNVSSQRLRMHNALNLTSPNEQQQPHPQQSAARIPYNMPPGNSPTLQGGEPAVYTAAGPMPRQLDTGNLATYPPAFNAPPVPSIMNETPYTSNVLQSSPPMVGLGGGDQLFASPVEHFPYMDPIGQNPAGQGTLPGPILYNTSTGGAMAYSMDASNFGQGHAYTHPGNGQHLYGNQ